MVRHERVVVLMINVYHVLVLAVYIIQSRHFVSFYKRNSFIDKAKGYKFIFDNVDSILIYK